MAKECREKHLPVTNKKHQNLFDTIIIIIKIDFFFYMTQPHVVLYKDVPKMIGNLMNLEEGLARKCSYRK